MYRSRIASSPIAAWRTAAERNRLAAEKGNASRRRTEPLVSFAAPKPLPTEPVPTKESSFTGVANSEPLLYHWQRTDSLRAHLGKLASADKPAASTSFVEHREALLRALPATSASDMTVARSVVAVLSEYDSAEHAQTLAAAYNQRASLLGKELIDLSGEIGYNTVQLPETATGQ